MLEKMYKTKNLAVARLSLLLGRDYISEGVIEHVECFDAFIIVKKIDYCLYKNVFTGAKIKTSSFSVRNGGIFLKKAYSIDEYLNDNELLTGKITKSRLVEIYRMLNKKEDEYDDKYENYQDGTNGKVIKLTKNRNKK